MKISAFSIVTLLIVLCTASSCKKSNTGLPSNTIQATINSKTSTFNIRTFATRTGTPGTPHYVILLTGLTDSTTLAGSIYLSIQGVNNITTTAYNENSTINNASISYINNIGLVGNNFSNGYTTSNPFTIVVTSINSQSIQGTFYGNIFHNGDSAQTLETVTNGKFNVNF
jgi:hypothetical protein